MRKSRDYLEKLKKKYGVDELYSWSKYHTYKTDPYGYLLKYILKKKESKTSIYAVSGGNVHDILERFYANEITYEQMLTEYEAKLFEMNLAELKYNRSDEDSNKKIADKYENCIRHFFQNHIVITDPHKLEQFVSIKVGEYVFQGYIDFISKDENGVYTVLDWKTSTIYTGKKVLSESGQLVLYAESLIQRGVPLEKIRIGWDFLKYCTVTQTLQTKDKVTKLNKTKDKNCLRITWVKDIASNIRKWLEKDGIDELTIEDMIQTAIENNNLDNLPMDVQSKFSVKDCFVTIPLTQEIIDNLKNDIVETLDNIKELTKEYNETKDDTLFWTDIDKTNEFFFANLMGYTVKEHRPYREYLDDLKIFTDEYNGNNRFSDSDKSFEDFLKDL